MDALSVGADNGGVGRDPPERAPLTRLAEEQAALRRVATLVARGAPPEEVFAAVAEEVGPGAVDTRPSVFGTGRP